MAGWKGTRQLLSQADIYKECTMESGWTGCTVLIVLLTSRHRTIDTGAVIDQIAAEIHVQYVLITRPLTWHRTRQGCMDQWSGEDQLGLIVCPTQSHINHFGTAGGSSGLNWCLAAGGDRHDLFPLAGEFGHDQERSSQRRT